MIAPYYSDDLVTLYHGDAEACARGLEPKSVQTIVTSPPYFGLRSYLDADHPDKSSEMGAEATVQEYVDRLVSLFRVLRHVLTDDGTLWLNLGDSYVAGATGSLGRGGVVAKSEHSTQSAALKRPSKLGLGIPEKNLLGIPWRVAFALQEDGWILRSDIIWAKPNPMPESVTDRPTNAHEYVFLFAKNPRYYYDADAVREPHEAPTVVHVNRNRPDRGFPGQADVSRAGNHPDGRNKRTVWTVPTVPFPGSHFAVYPPDLVRPCIRAGSKPGDVVLDPFSGSGTTGAVATYEGRRYVGIDLNRDYLDLSLRTRFAQPVLDLTGGGAA